MDVRIHIAYVIFIKGILMIETISFWYPFLLYTVWALPIQLTEIIFIKNALFYSDHISLLSAITIQLTQRKNSGP